MQAKKNIQFKLTRGRQGPHRDREVSSTHYHPHTPTLHYPLHAITSLPCPPPLLDPLVLHSNSPSSTLFPCNLSRHPSTYLYTLYLSMQSLLHHSPCLLPLLPTPPPFFVRKASGARCREPSAEPSDSTAAGLAISHDGRYASYIIAHIEHNQMYKLLYVYSMSQHNINILFYTVEPVCFATVTVWGSHFSNSQLLCPQRA